MVRLAALVAGYSLALSGCRSAPGAPSATELQASHSTADVTDSSIELPDSCVLFLAQVECWLHRAGNDSSSTDRAVGAARALFQSPTPSRARPDDTAARCERAMAARRTTFASAGCENVVPDLRFLPPADPVTCPPDEHFFIRRDGWIAGCHPDCARSEDCPGGTTCASIGTAPGGPIEEPFCE